MKKTLIALAAVAAASSAMAQATISGTFGLGYGNSVTGEAAVAVTDGDVAFAVKEDLGGGLTLSASAGFDFGAKAGEDLGETNFVKVGLTTPFGKFDYGNTKSASARLDVGASLTNDVNEMLGGDTKGYQAIKYTLPEMVKDLSMAITVEDTTAIDSDSAFVYAIGYKAGAFNIGYDYRESDKRDRVSLSYDLGFAKVAMTSDISADDEDELAITVPVNSALTVGMHYGREKDQSAKGYELAAVYALSKKTSVVASFADLKTAQTIDNKAVYDGTNYRVKLVHSF